MGRTYSTKLKGGKEKGMKNEGGEKTMGKIEEEKKGKKEEKGREKRNKKVK